MQQKWRRPYTGMGWYHVSVSQGEKRFEGRVKAKSRKEAEHWGLKEWEKKHGHTQAERGFKAIYIGQQLPG